MTGRVGRRPKYLEPLTPPPSSWALDAACQNHPNPDMWHPNTTGRSREQFRAIAICLTCPVRQQCLDYAITNNECLGIWGGYGERRRRELRRELNREKNRSS